MHPDIKNAIKNIVLGIVLISAMVFTHTFDNAKRTPHVVGSNHNNE